jgi:hypothetical protein
MTFEEYLGSKKIDSQAFYQAEPELWKEWNELFDQMSQASFTSQKLYLINPVRRKYLLKVVEPLTKTESPASKPVMRPKPKMN